MKYALTHNYTLHFQKKNSLSIPKVLIKSNTPYIRLYTSIVTKNFQIFLITIEVKKTKMNCY